MTDCSRMPTRTREVFDHLKRCADDMRTVDYEELAKAARLAPRGIGRPLGYVRDCVCRRHSLPWLTAIAVSKRTGRPREGFLPEGVAMGHDKERLWRGMVLQVFAYDWGGVELED